MGVEPTELGSGKESPAARWNMGVEPTELASGKESPAARWNMGVEPTELASGKESPASKVEYGSRTHGASKRQRVSSKQGGIWESNP